MSISVILLDFAGRGPRTPCAGCTRRSGPVNQRLPVPLSWTTRPAIAKSTRQVNREEAHAYPTSFNAMPEERIERLSLRSSSLYVWLAPICLTSSTDRLALKELAMRIDIFNIGHGQLRRASHAERPAHDAGFRRSLGRDRFCTPSLHFFGQTIDLLG
jgi:hypothetical protein